MTLRLVLTPELERRLSERAAEAGLDLNSFVLRVISEELEVGPQTTNGVGAERTFAKRIAALHRWVEQQPDRPVIADDSRDSIYGERGI